MPADDCLMFLANLCNFCYRVKKSEGKKCSLTDAMCALAYALTDQ